MSQQLLWVFELLTAQFFEHRTCDNYEFCVNILSLHVWIVIHLKYFSSSDWGELHVVKNSVQELKCSTRVQSNNNKPVKWYTSFALFWGISTLCFGTSQQFHQQSTRQPNDTLKTAEKFSLQKCTSIHNIVALSMMNHWKLTCNCNCSSARRNLISTTQHSKLYDYNLCARKSVDDAIIAPLSRKNAFNSRLITHCDEKLFILYLVRSFIFFRSK